MSVKYEDLQYSESEKKSQGFTEGKGKGKQPLLKSLLNMFRRLSAVKCVMSAPLPCVLVGSPTLKGVRAQPLWDPI